MNRNFVIKVKEALASVLPITVIVLILHFSIAPLSFPLIVLFLLSAALLILGMGLFTLGADIAMIPMGQSLGSFLFRSRKLVLVLIVCFLMGLLVTIAEPDLTVLAQQVPTVPNHILILSVAVGVGFFLAVSFLRIIFRIKLAYMLLGFYLLIFIFSFFAPPEYLPVAFDSGGVTTGPITVPFIMAFGIGLAAVRGGKSAQEDSFGLVALCSIGPILAVLVLSMFYETGASSYAPSSVSEISSLSVVFSLMLRGFPHFGKDVLIALSPILLVFALFQLFFLRQPRNQFLKVIVGMVYTYIGLVLFLTAVNVGFMPIGDALGHALARLDYNWILVPLGMVIGFFVVAAEPAVHVLKKEVEEVSAGAISQWSMLIALCIGVSLSIGLSMLRVLAGINLLVFLIPGYILSLTLTFFVPRMFTAIAFDSGGVASGPMTATFILSFVIGVTDALGGNLLSDAFGVVAMVAMTPLVTLQLLGLFAVIKTGKEEGGGELPPTGDVEREDIIDL